GTGRADAVSEFGLDQGQHGSVVPRYRSQPVIFCSPPDLFGHEIPTGGAEMNDLLEAAVAAHGGLDRWNQVKSITVDASITGAFWHLKGKGDALRDVRFEVDTTRERLTMDLAGQDKRSVFEPGRVVMQRRDGTLTGARDDPEKSFAGHQLETPWDDIHLAY